jgi:hypothetical protein
VIETESNILASPEVTEELEIFLGDLKDMRNTLSRYFPTTRRLLVESRDTTRF